jgi:aminomuconate-semialdehyde/2-hydroxymuconate-6-semialdehyde dehydrogenase
METIDPTIWTGLPDDASVVNEEIFGPCCHITELSNVRVKS